MEAFDPEWLDDHSIVGYIDNFVDLRRGNLSLLDWLWARCLNFRPHAIDPERDGWRHAPSATPTDQLQEMQGMGVGTVGSSKHGEEKQR